MLVPQYFKSVPMYFKISICLLEIGFHLPSTNCVFGVRKGKVFCDLFVKRQCFKGKVHLKNLLISDINSDEIRKNAVERFSLSFLVVKIFAFKIQKLVIWRPPS